jgi:hypothetical protein
MRDLQLFLFPIDSLSRDKRFTPHSGSKKKGPRSLDGRVYRFVLPFLKEVPPGVLFFSAAPPALSLAAKAHGARPHRPIKAPKARK